MSKTMNKVEVLNAVETILQLRFITVTAYTHMNDPRTVHVRIGDIGAIEEQPDDSRKEYKTGIALKYYPDKVMLLKDTYDQIIKKIDDVRHEIYEEIISDVKEQEK